MRDNGIIDTIRELIETDPACLSTDGIRDVMSKIRHVRGWADAGLLECSRRLEELSSASNAAADASFTLAGAMDHSNAEATSTVDQAALCNTNTELEDSLAAGKITSRHLALIARCRNKLSVEERSDFDLEIDRIHRWAVEHHFKMFEQEVRDLVARIKHAHSPDNEIEELERQRQASTVKSWVDKASGLHNHLLSMDPVRAAKFSSAMNAELAALRNQHQDNREPFGSLQIEAIINAMSGGQAAARSSELIVVVDHDSLHSGRHERTVCETVDGAPLPVPFAQHLCEQALVHFFALDEHGNVSDYATKRTHGTHSIHTDQPADRRPSDEPGIDRQRRGTQRPGGQPPTEQQPSEQPQGDRHPPDLPLAADRLGRNPTDGDTRTDRPPGDDRSGGRPPRGRSTGNNRPGDRAPVVTQSAGDRSDKRQSDRLASRAAPPGTTESACGPPDVAESSDREPCNSRSNSGEGRPDSNPEGDQMQPATTTAPTRLKNTSIKNTGIKNSGIKTSEILAEIADRVANRAQRRALAAMYRSCAFPECTVGFSHTRMHHVRFSTLGGKTMLANLLPVCETHHHFIHDFGWTLTLDPTTRRALFTEPNRGNGDSHPRRFDTWPDRTPTSTHRDGSHRAVPRPSTTDRADHRPHTDTASEDR